MNKVFNNKATKEIRSKLRNNRPEPEIKFWYYIRNRQLGIKFRRQVGIGEYIVDFYSPEVKMVIEIDGDSHYNPESIAEDGLRDQYLENLGLRIIRFNNLEVRENIEGVILKIKELIPTSPNPSLKRRGENTHNL